MCNVVRDSGPGETPVMGGSRPPRNPQKAPPPAPFGISAATPKPSAANTCGAPGVLPETSSPAALGPQQEDTAEDQVNTLTRDSHGRARGAGTGDWHLTTLPAAVTPKAAPGGCRRGKDRCTEKLLGWLLQSHHKQTHPNPSSR